MIDLNKPNKLPPKIKWYVLTKIVLLLFLICSPLLLFGKSNWFVGVFLFFLFFVGLPLFIYLLLYYKFISFVVENDKITINSGIIIKRSNTISFDNVQNVENIRGILYRIFGLSKVNIWTSSPQQIEVKKKETIHKPTGTLELTIDDGEWLKNFILSKKS
jgi:uncharacterized membrane protein YdbT with pleckstrin-like domain